jgi:hypothetical protein
MLAAFQWVAASGWKSLRLPFLYTSSINEGPIDLMLLNSPNSVSDRKETVGS